MALEAPSVRTSAEGERCRLRVVLACDERLRAKARYTLDTLLMAAGIVAVHAPEPPATGEPWLLYGPAVELPTPSRCFHVQHAPAAWRYLDGASDGIFLRLPNGAVDPFPTEPAAARANSGISFDLVAAAFYFLSCWAERSAADGANSRSLHADSVFARHGVSMDVVDRYLQALLQGLESTCGLRTRAAARVARRRFLWCGLVARRRFSVGAPRGGLGPRCADAGPAPPATTRPWRRRPRARGIPDRPNPRARRILSTRRDHAPGAGDGRVIVLPGCGRALPSK